MKFVDWALSTFDHFLTRMTKGGRRSAYDTGCLSRVSHDVLAPEGRWVVATSEGRLGDWNSWVCECEVISPRRGEGGARWDENRATPSPLPGRDDPCDIFPRVALRSLRDLASPVATFRRSFGASAFVIPAQAGIQSVTGEQDVRWMPACAGMTLQMNRVRSKLCLEVQDRHEVDGVIGVVGVGEGECDAEAEVPVFVGEGLERDAGAYVEGGLIA
jgi:hypothetical protein